MTETQHCTSSLRAILPRLFSRAQPVGAVDRLLKTVRTHHPKADVAIIERAYAAADKAHSGQLFTTVWRIAGVRRYPVQA